MLEKVEKGNAPSRTGESERKHWKLAIKMISENNFPDLNKCW